MILQNGKLSEEFDRLNESNIFHICKMGII
jgi:hypothetical protein